MKIYELEKFIYDLEKTLNCMYWQTKDFETSIKELKKEIKILKEK